jgi:quercetin dioxygenase-like cupin family protein
MERTMRKLLLVLSLTLLLSAHVSAAGGDGVMVQVLSKTGSSWDGKALPAYSSGKPEITILKITVPPGVQLPLHSHPVINAGVLLNGELTVVSEDNNVLHLKAGEPIVEVVNTWHYGKNEGTTPAVIIVFYAGAAGTPVTINRPGPR